MVFGHNTNLKLGSVTFHVQTEDRGAAHALIDTTVYHNGRVLHRRTNNYFDLLPLNEDTLQALKLRLDEQHRTVLEEIRSGALQLAVPQAPTGAPVAKVVQTRERSEVGNGNPEHASVPVPAKNLHLELLNARNWLVGKEASLNISVKEESGEPVIGAEVAVEIEGAAGHLVYNGRTGSDGSVTIAFEMPRISAPEAALVVNATDQTGSGHLRFSLRAKPRVPAV